MWLFQCTYVEHVIGALQMHWMMMMMMVMMMCDSFCLLLLFSLSRSFSGSCGSGRGSREATFTCGDTYVKKYVAKILRENAKCKYTRTQWIQTLVCSQTSAIQCDKTQTHKNWAKSLTCRLHVIIRNLPKLLRKIKNAYIKNVIRFLCQAKTLLPVQRKTITRTMRPDFYEGDH